MNAFPRRPLETYLGLGVLALLMLGCLVVMRPFLSSLLWAIVLCFTSWPAYGRLLRWVGHRRTLAASLMAVVMVLVILMPFLVMGFTVSDDVRQLTGAAKAWVEVGPSDPPDWLARLPLVGEPLAHQWRAAAFDNAGRLNTLRRFIEPASGWLLSAGLLLGRGLFQLGVSVFVAFFLFLYGYDAARQLSEAVQSIAGERGQRMLDIAGRTVRGIVYGLLGTALLQGTLAGIGFMIARVPGAGMLALFTFFFSVLPIGPPLIWIPSALWLFHERSAGWGIFMLVWGVGVSSVDNFVKPWLISQGSRMPFLLVFFGVLGGALAFGFIGVFLGPTLLAVGYRLLQEWIAGRVRVAVQAPPGAAGD